MIAPARIFFVALLLAHSCFSWAATPQLSFNFEFEKLEQALKLTPAQKDQYELAVGATKRMLLQVALVALRVKEKLAEELAKPRPDFGVLADLRRSIVEEGRPLRREAREQWRKLYDMLDQDQVEALRRFVDERLDHLGLLHNFMMGLVLGGR